MTFPCAYSRNDAVAAHGWKANSSFCGVMLGVGIWNLTSERIEEPFAEFERWRAWPKDIVCGLQDGGVSRGCALARASASRGNSMDQGNRGFRLQGERIQDLAGAPDSLQCAR